MQFPISKAIVMIVLLCASSGNASSPVFLQAIQSALATIPFSGFPMTMTAGLAGAKLAVGGKLLYFLGLFGRSGRNKPPNAMPAQFSGASGKPMTQAGLLPMPYALLGGGGGFPGQFPGFGQSIPLQVFGSNTAPPQQSFASKPPSVNPAVLMNALAEQGINPLQLMQALGSAGMDPMRLMEFLEDGGDFERNQQPMSPGNRAGQSRPIFSSVHSEAMMEMPHDLTDSLPPSSAVQNNQDQNLGSNEDVESFFSFMKDMDDNKCISRLICDIGADPDFLGEFSRNIDTIISSLDVSSESGAYDYVQIMDKGRDEGNCEKFSECDNEAYDIVKSVAPSVGVPDGINSEAVNKL